MEGWIGFLKVHLYTGLGLFACMSLWVIVAGFGDIKRMLRAEMSHESENGDIFG